MSEQFTPLDIIRETIQYWWFIALTMLLGAAAGGVFFAIRPPVYEARAAISISIDFVYTGKLTDIEEDHALGVVGDILFSSEVMEEIVSSAISDGWEIDLETFMQIANAERRFYVWQIRVLHEDPALAAALANYWLEAASDTLSKAMRHAKNADSLQRKVDALENCFHSVTSEPVHAYCNLKNLEDIQVELAKTGDEVQQEIFASQGVLAGTGFTISEKAVPAVEPIRYGRSSVILAGMMIGFLAGVIGLSLRLPASLIRRGADA